MFLLNSRFDAANVPARLRALSAKALPFDARGRSIGGLSKRVERANEKEERTTIMLAGLAHARRLRERQLSELRGVYISH